MHMDANGPHAVETLGGSRECETLRSEVRSTDEQAGWSLRNRNRFRPGSRVVAISGGAQSQAEVFWKCFNGTSYQRTG